MTLLDLYISSVLFSSRYKVIITSGHVTFRIIFFLQQYHFYNNNFQLIAHVSLARRNKNIKNLCKREDIFIRKLVLDRGGVYRDRTLRFVVSFSRNDDAIIVVFPSRKDTFDRSLVVCRGYVW